MPNIQGKNFSAVDDLKMASGTNHNAGVRRFGNSADLATEGGGTADPIKVCVLPVGTVFDELKMAASVDLSALTFTLGTAAEPAKYMTATAGPNAAIKSGMGLPAKRAMDPLAYDEELILTPSGNWPAAGTIEASVYASMR